MMVTAAMPERNLDLVVPLAHEATAMRTTETAGSSRVSSGAIACGSDLASDLYCTTFRPTLAMSLTPGTRTSTTATRTTTTCPASCASGRSADEDDASFPFHELVAAYFDCRRNKRTSLRALDFEASLERNLVALYDDLVAGNYRPGRSICFIVTSPKPREVWAAEFRDRVVHHLLYNHIGSRFERAFIADSCACVPGRGTLYAARRLEAKVRSITQNWSRRAFYLKLDLANFFVSIDKRILAGQLGARISEAWWRDLALQILNHDPRTDVELRGDPARMALIPPHKSLFNQPAHLGLPIGNLSSQFFANVYLDALDQYAKHGLCARHYIRYVDDFVLLHESPQWLNAAHAEIDAWLPRELHVRLNPAKTILQPIERGIDFVGHLIKPWRRVIRRRTYRTALARTAQIDAEDLFETANSYFGLLRQASHSHADRAELANLLRGRGHSINRQLTQTYRRPL
jgi:RNA-directed DNA polymerase